jgi:tetratricopeptide (TPR) repeat protein
MARFDDLFVIKAPPPGAPAPEGVDYIFEISIASADGVVEGFGRLRSAKDGRIVWTASASRPAGAFLQDQDLADIGRRVGTRLAEPFGIIHADFRQNASSSAMQCILQAFDYRRFMTPERHNTARACLEQLVQREPEFYPAWAQLAMLGASDAVSGPEAEQRPALDRALSSALVAMRLAPSGARAQQAMMDVLFLRGTAGDAVKAGREALNRNPYDPEVMAALGSVYVRLNRPAEGLPLLERAIAISPGRPPWYDFYAYLAAYLTGAKRLSETYAAVLEADDTPFSLLGQALQAGTNGDVAKRDAALQVLVKKVPRFEADPRTFLARKGFADEVVQRILATLGLAGR